MDGTGAAMSEGPGDVPPVTRYEAKPATERRSLESGPAAGLEYDWLSLGPLCPKAPLVIASHGFMRDAKRMRGLATHLAARGYAVACPHLRHSRPWSGGHTANAKDIAGLAKQLGEGRKVVLIGFSAGAWSSFLAATESAPDALVLLDPVFAGATDDEDHTFSGPALALMARPGKCNANGGSRAAVEALPRVRVLDLKDASHAHFEFPIDPLAKAVCGGATGDATDAEIQDRILAEITDFLMREVPAPDAAAR